MRKIAILLFGLGLLFAVASPAMATHKPGHHEPPACDRGQAKGNKHCYPPRRPPACDKGQAKGNPHCEEGVDSGPVSFTEQPTPPGLTVGMLTIAGLGTFAVVVASRSLRRRLGRRFE